eukprot:GHVU01009528.1.p1 GENE.GHVU01009528.1~~GHVU01009528.1.p1  ORF type:complete len:184 (-),score=25.57 GHVU01009528.1:1117-1611(-)
MRERAYSQPPKRFILLAVDTSENSKYMFQWFLDNILRSDDMVILTHCPEAPKLPTLTFKSGMTPPVDEWKKILDETNSRTRSLEEDYEGTCIQKKLRYKVRGESYKKPGEGILKIADSENVDMIVMGTRGISGLKRVVMGSTSEYVVKNAKCPVIVVPKFQESK